VIRVGSVVIKVTDLAAQKAFWMQALDYVDRPGDDDDFALLKSRNGIWPNVSLDAHPSERALPPRTHLDLYADDQAAEVVRLEALGARRVEWNKRPADADYVIMENPEGTRFCVVQL
jgi:hypothetical protein